MKKYNPLLFATDKLAITTVHKEEREKMRERSSQTFPVISCLSSTQSSENYVHSSTPLIIKKDVQVLYLKKLFSTHSCELSPRLLSVKYERNKIEKQEVKGIVIDRTFAWRPVRKGFLL